MIRQISPPAARDTLVPSLAILLGAGPGRVSGPMPATPAALDLITGDTRALDWTLEALAASGVEAVKYVAGYRAETVLRDYPHLDVVINPDWHHTHTLGSLSRVMPLPASGVLLQYGDTLFRPSVYERLLENPSPAVCAFDSEFTQRLLDDVLREQAEKVVLDGTQIIRAGRRSLPSSQAGGQLTGLILLRGQAAEATNDFFRDNAALVAKGSLTDLLLYLIQRRIAVAGIDAARNWAELDTPEDLARFVLGTKGRTLERLSRLVKSSVVDPFFLVDAAHWALEADSVLADVAASFRGRRVIVRSSAMAEDGWAQSNAGAFRSIGRVDPGDSKAVRNAIEDVFDSFPSRSPGNEVLLQPHLEDVALAGVLFTRNPHTAAPYYVASYASGSLGTDAVTAGRTSELTTTIIMRSARATASSAMAVVLAAAEEIERLVGFDALDIEFALDANGVVHLLQVRPLAGCLGRRLVLDSELAEEVTLAGRQIEAAVRAHPSVMGARGILANMSDWNPAEIIGVTPSPLSASLYHELVTADVWSASRAALGYRDLTPRPLMLLVAGRPYVDVRASFNSFVPAEVDPGLADRLVTHYLNRLRERPELHDKVEFDVVFSCLTFDFDITSERLRAAGLGPDDVRALRDALRRVTSSLIGIRGEGAARFLEDLPRLAEARLHDVPTADFEALGSLILRSTHAIKRYGTLPFANLARMAFVATAMLRSLVAAGHWAAEELDEFMLSIDTVAGRLARDIDGFHVGEVPRDEFLSRYGHLRPGTYDLCAPSYAEAPDLYLGRVSADTKRHKGSSPAKPDWWPSADQMRRLAEALRQADLEIGPDAFISFCRSSIEGRELAKFEFTKALSVLLGQIADLGGLLGLDRADISMLRLGEIVPFGLTGRRVHDVHALRSLIEHRRAQHNLTAAVMLPHLLDDSVDLLCFDVPASHPNFVTRKTVVGRLIDLDTMGPTGPLEGSIVLCQHADPGYDWLFGRGIAALVTVYGGANSHMAIRCAEFGLPAAIGVGETRAEDLRCATVVRLDCDSQVLARMC